MGFYLQGAFGNERAHLSMPRMCALGERTDEPPKVAGFRAGGRIKERRLQQAKWWISVLFMWWRRGAPARRRSRLTGNKWRSRRRAREGPGFRC